MTLSPLVLALSLSTSLLAQPPSPSLLETITAQDALLFGAVNRCDLPTVEAMFSPDLEFYHDKADPQFGRAVVVTNIKNNLCHQIQRQLVPGSIEVYPIQNYGAVQIGVHRFLHIGANDRDVVGEAKFIHLWRLQEGKWQITRVISFDHAAAQQAAPLPSQKGIESNTQTTHIAPQPGPAPQTGKHLER